VLFVYTNMPKVLSLKLREDIFLDAEAVVRKMHIPRNTYINQAIEFYTKLHNRSLIAKQLSKESKLVANDSMDILKEFEAFTEEHE
jgi:hypothetical protein